MFLVYLTELAVLEQAIISDILVVTSQLLSVLSDYTQY